MHAWYAMRAVIRALIGGGGVYIHILAFYLTTFFRNQLSLELISKEIRRAEHKFMNIHPTVNAQIAALYGSIQFLHTSKCVTRKHCLT